MDIKCEICGSAIRMTPGSSTAICGTCGAIVFLEAAPGEHPTASQGAVAGEAEPRAPVAPPAAVPDPLEALLSEAEECLRNRQWKRARECAERVLAADDSRARAYLAKVCATRRVCDVDDLDETDKLLSRNRDFQKALHRADSALRSHLEALAQRNREYVEETRPSKPPTRSAAAAPASGDSESETSGDSESGIIDDSSSSSFSYSFSPYRSHHYRRRRRRRILVGLLVLTTIVAAVLILCLTGVLPWPPWRAFFR